MRNVWGIEEEECMNIRVLVFLICAFSASPPASAPRPSVAGIEGHELDAKTLRPLPNAITPFVLQLPSGAGGAVRTQTDQNGFYSFQLSPPPELPSVLEFTASCVTRRGTGQT